jgi:hypothetical protein
MTIANSKYSQFDLNIIETGRRDYAAGLMKCPFVPNSRANRLWLLGWLEAKHEAAKAA